MRARIASGDYRETDSPNRGPAIDKLEQEFGLLGQSWCAMWAIEPFYVCKRQGLPGLVPPLIAGSQALLRWFQSQGFVSSDPQDVLDWGGALAIRTNPDGVHGHVAPIFMRFTTGDGQLIAVQTEEGNTDVHMGSNGDGAYSHRRAIPLTPYTWHYCRTDELAGGRWWRGSAPACQTKPVPG